MNWAEYLAARGQIDPPPIDMAAIERSHYIDLLKEADEQVNQLLEENEELAILALNPPEPPVFKSTLKAVKYLALAFVVGYAVGQSSDLIEDVQRWRGK